MTEYEALLCRFRHPGVGPNDGYEALLCLFRHPGVGRDPVLQVIHSFER
jgi:hypothetical protein